MHDCSACRHFIKSYGGLVFIDDSYKVRTLWEFDTIPEYKASIEGLHNLVLNSKIIDVEKLCLNKDNAINRGELGISGNSVFKDGVRIDYDHFSIHLSIPKVSKNLKYLFNFMESTFNIIKLENVKDVINLIEENNLYRGIESLAALKDIAKILFDYQGLESEEEKTNYIWYIIGTTKLKVLTIKNSGLSTLIWTNFIRSTAEIQLVLSN